MLAMLSQANGMNAEQANELVTRIVDLSQAATTAAQAAHTMMQSFQPGKGGGQRFGDGARVLKAPDTFDTDDPVRYSFWREQFMNWLVFCDGRYGDLIKDVENLDTVEPMHSLSPEIQELGTKLYSILVSYLRGPAFQVIRAFSNERNGFAVWHRLKALYAPRARPRALAIGQAIMQHPGFPSQRAMLENVLNFDALLDQYELASGAKMPDDLAISTVLRCIDAPTRRHLEMVMDDDITYSKLKEKLILQVLEWRWFLAQPSAAAEPIFEHDIPRPCSNGSGSSSVWSEGQRKEQRQDKGQERRLVWNAIWWQVWWWKEFKRQRKTKGKERQRQTERKAERQGLWWKQQCVPCLWPGWSLGKRVSQQGQCEPGQFVSGSRSTCWPSCWW